MMKWFSHRYLDLLGSIYIYNEHRGYTALDRVLEAVKAKHPHLDFCWVAKESLDRLRTVSNQCCSRANRDGWAVLGNYAVDANQLSCCAGYSINIRRAGGFRTQCIIELSTNLIC